ncbi:MAG TPA: hypothetical protein VN634_09565, partial [Candidatus Limnocylindrales bacterium]|nr:hypothetical protein [Candidatus Limnocylindrales bacterium]
MKTASVSRFIAIPLSIFLITSLPPVVAAQFSSTSTTVAVCGDGFTNGSEQCDDGNLEDGDCCSSTCQIDPIDTPCTDDGNECTTDACICPGVECFTVFCGHTPRPGNPPCDDGNGCTLNETCNSDGNCSSNNVIPDGNTCQQDDLCGGTGICGNGFCQGDPADCSNFFEGEGPCEEGVCNPQTQQCELVPDADGTQCSVGEGFCSGYGECDTGECLPATRDCSAFDAPCFVGMCSDQIGCFGDQQPQGTPCTADACTTPGNCSDCADCVGGQPQNCSSFADQCNDAACDVETGCFAHPKSNGTTCNDGNICTLSDQCIDGVCSGTPKDCSSLTDACHTGTCDAETGECVAITHADGSRCNDHDKCTVDDSCQAGVCSGSAKDCSELNDACNTGTCNPQNGQCDAVSNTGPCNDGLFCNGADTCAGGSCSVHAGDPCTGGGICGSTCNESADNCFASANTVCRASAGICDMAENCTGSSATCPSNTFASGNTCRSASGICDVAETCNGLSASCPADGFASTSVRCRASSGECDVAEFCSGAATCPADSFASGSTPCTSDGNACTNDLCNGSGTCAHPNNTAPCNDGTFCNGADTCSGGTCSVHAGNPCTGGGICGSSCNETADNCFASANTVCRASAGICDMAENCTGSSATCPS